MKFDFQIRLFDIIFVVVFIFVVAFGFNDIKDHFFGKKTEPIKSKIVKLDDNLVLVENIPNEEEFNKIVKELKEKKSRALQVAQDQARKNGSKVVDVGTIKVKKKASFANKPSEVYEDPEMATRSYVEASIDETVKGEVLPIGWVKYHPAIKKDPFSIFLYPLEYHTTIVKNEKEDGSFDYVVEMWMENNFVSTSKGKKYPVDIKEVKFESKPISSKSFSFNPRVGFGVAVTSENVPILINTNLFSYGRTARDMDWQFVGVGVGYSEKDKEITGIFSPVSYNIGNPMPIIENLFFGPAISIDKSGTGLGAITYIPF